MKKEHYLYGTWSDIKKRCLYPKYKQYYLYGGRGIKICDRWLNCFEDFLKDMGERPSQKHSIERINNNGDYEPSNCRWATKKEQSCNKRSNIMISYQNKNLCLSQWSELLNLNYRALLARFNRGWEAEKIFRTPIRPPVKFINFDGKELSLKEWSKEVKMPYRTISARLMRGWTSEEILTIPNKNKLQKAKK